MDMLLWNIDVHSTYLTTDGETSDVVTTQYLTREEINKLLNKDEELLHRLRLIVSVGHGVNVTRVYLLPDKFKSFDDFARYGSITPSFKTLEERDKELEEDMKRLIKYYGEDIDRLYRQRDRCYALLGMTFE